jgi:hypothetical protein
MTITRSTFRGFAPFAAAILVALAGCRSDEGASALSTAGTPQVAPEGKVLQSELRAYCPQVVLLSDSAVYNSYLKKDEEEPSKLVFRASVADATRKCSYAPGTLGMEVALAGKVVPGPAAKDGTVTLPIRVEVRSGGEVLYSHVTKQEVAITKTGGAVQFIFNDPNVSFPTPRPGTVAVTVGFDLPKKPKTDDLL